MATTRDAETIGLLFKLMAQHRCATVSDLALQLGVPYGPPVLEALGITGDSRDRWDEVETLVSALQYRERHSEVSTDPLSADQFAPSAAPREPITALQALREAVGLTAGQLAAKVGVPLGTVGDWERGTAIPETRQVGQLAQALGTSEEQVRAALPHAASEE